MLKKRTAVLCLLVLALGPAATWAGEPPEAYWEALEEAGALMRAKDFKAAVQVLKTAETLADELTFDCLYGLAVSFNGVKSFQAGAANAQLALELAEGRTERALASNQLGVGLFAGGKGGREAFEEAAKAFELAWEHSQGGLDRALYNRGVVLLNLDREEEGLGLLREYLRNSPDGRHAKTARAYLDNPKPRRGGRAASVPSQGGQVPVFAAHTLEGDRLTSEDLEGKVVLFDFWGTWCAPCVASIPHLRRLSRKSTKDPFVIVSVSSDRDEAVLRRFVDKNRMTWPQIWDDRRELIRSFQVSSYPTYVLVDHEGVLLARHSGWSSRLEAAIEREVSRAVRKARKATGQ